MVPFYGVYGHGTFWAVNSLTIGVLSILTSPKLIQVLAQIVSWLKERFRVSFDPFKGVYGPRNTLGRKLFHTCVSMSFLGSNHLGVHAKIKSKPQGKFEGILAPKTWSLRPKELLGRKLPSSHDF